MRIRYIEHGLIEVQDGPETTYHGPWILARSGYVSDETIARAILNPNTYFDANKRKTPKDRVTRPYQSHFA